jgi:heptosyltransferase-1
VTHAASPPAGAGDDRRFLIVRLGALGDVIHAIPAAAALRRQFPGARIDWLVDPRYTDLLGLVTGLDTAIGLDPRAGAGDTLTTLRRLRASRYDAAIDLQGLLKSAVLARAAGARRTVGFTASHLREPAARFCYSETVDPGDAAHVIDKNLALLTAVGVGDLARAFPIAVPRTAAVERVEQELNGRRFALLNPGAAWPNKRWPADRFGALAAALRDRDGLESLVLWGPGEEALAQSVVDFSRGAARPSPATTVVDVFGIARAASVMISGDTGPLHIAGAAGTPLVALFGPTRAERNGPWDPSDIVVSRTATCACLYERRCRRDAPCIEDIGVDDVIDAVERRLALAFPDGRPPA